MHEAAARKAYMYLSAPHTESCHIKTDNFSGWDLIGIKYEFWHVCVCVSVCRFILLHWTNWIDESEVFRGRVLKKCMCLGFWIWGIDFDDITQSMHAVWMINFFSFYWFTYPNSVYWKLTMETNSIPRCLCCVCDWISCDCVDDIIEIINFPPETSCLFKFYCYHWHQFDRTHFKFTVFDPIPGELYV